MPDVSSPRPRSRARNAQRLQRSAGSLSTAALARMERDMPWVAELPAQERAWLGMIVQAGIKAFVDWYRDPTSVSPLQSEVFGQAPRAMAGVITLQQTVELVRLSIEVVEENVVDVVGELDAPAVRQAINSYAREVAFATADVYARAAEQRGAWDARLEALVVDSILRGDSPAALSSRASALGWAGSGHVVVIIGGLAKAESLEQVRHYAQEHRLDVLCAVQGSRLVVVLGGVDSLGRPVAQLVDAFADGPVVMSPVVESLLEAPAAAQAAESAYRAAPGWRDAPRPVSSDDLLVERALLDDEVARDDLIALIARLGGDLMTTLEAWVSTGYSVEATGRSLFVHPNTVRYRLKRISELTGLTPTVPREAFVLSVGLALSRLGADQRDDL